MGAAPFTVISGGQTGVDRAALDAALNANVPCGGWCPEGRKAEDGVIPVRYPVRELPGADYPDRTRRNVEDSDATLVITFGPATGGTAHTLELCRQFRKPHRVIDAEVTSAEDGARQALELLQQANVRRLNVAGPRASGEPRAYPYALQLMQRMLASMRQESGPGRPA